MSSAGGEQEDFILFHDDEEKLMSIIGDLRESFPDYKIDVAPKPLYDTIVAILDHKIRDKDLTFTVKSAKQDKLSVVPLWMMLDYRALFKEYLLKLEKQKKKRFNLIIARWPDLNDMILNQNE